MKFLSFFLVAGLIGVSAKNETKPVESGPAYIGTEKMAVKFDGQMAVSMDFSELGITVGAFDDNPEDITTSIVIKNSSSGSWSEINANMKLILKVAGNPMVLTTIDGTNWNGSHDSYHGAAGVMGALAGVIQYIYTSKAYFPVSQSQLDSLMTYGFTKYRFQTVSGVNEGEFSERKSLKIGDKIKDAYETVRAKQAETSAKMNDLSDF